ncbi:MAG TPA: hypothetical protein VHA56_03145 [Mucilaginibacter sp.]|nr:hypothetical protein [Mucilaginibacter sp.]
MFADEFGKFSGGTDNQVSAVLRQSKAPPGAGLFPVVMPKLPPYKKRNLSFKAPNIDLPSITTLINIAVIGFIGLAAYKLYQKFFGDTLANKKEDAGNTAFDKIYVDTKQSKADEVTATAASLNSAGLTVSDLHKKVANSLHDLMDSIIVDHDKIVATIKGEAIPTFQLVSVAYGTRTLNTYKAWHIFNPDAWKGFGLTGTDSQDTLKAHLNLVLSSSELSSISQWLSAI